MNFSRNFIKYFAICVVFLFVSLCYLQYSVLLNHPTEDNDALKFVNNIVDKELHVLGDWENKTINYVNQMFVDKQMELLKSEINYLKNELHLLRPGSSSQDNKDKEAHKDTENSEDKGRKSSKQQDSHEDKSLHSEDAPKGSVRERRSRSSRNSTKSNSENNEKKAETEQHQKKESSTSPPHRHRIRGGTAVDSHSSEANKSHEVNEISKSEKGSHEKKLSNTNATKYEFNLESVLDEIKKRRDIRSYHGPDDTVTSVVKCSTTKGNLTLDIRSNWAPKGAQRYLDLVRGGFFDDLPFFRVCPRYIMQFGLKYHNRSTPMPYKCSNIPDDKPLTGKRDMDLGYLFFAGSGVNSRGCQMVLALCELEGCVQTTLGAALWEVPFGTVRKDGFEVLRELGQSGFPYPKLEMTGQHPKAGGPDLGKIATQPNYLHETYPAMEYWRGCKIVSEGELRNRPLIIDHPTSVFGLPQSKNASKPVIRHEFVEIVIGIKRKLITRTNVTVYRTEDYSIIVEVYPEWARNGAARFLELVDVGYFSNNPFFRTIRNFVAQFGLNVQNTDRTRHWMTSYIPDDEIPSNVKNSKGTITFASYGHNHKNSRTCQLFINLADNHQLDAQGFTPIGKIIYGTGAGDLKNDYNVIDKIYHGYGDMGVGDRSDKKGPSQARLIKEGKAYAEKYFPMFSIIKSAKILKI